MSESTDRPRVTEVGRVLVPVADQERALDFYLGALGFEKRGDQSYDDPGSGTRERWIEVAPPGAATALALVLPREGLTAGTSTRVLLRTQDVDTDHADLRARGVDVDPEVMRMGGPVPPMFFLRDPDGNSLAIVEDG